MSIERGKNHGPLCLCDFCTRGMRRELHERIVSYPENIPPLRTVWGGVTIPNAICPICGAVVFFYIAPNGGRVFFDSLGPPWPKHGCTSGVEGGLVPTRIPLSEEQKAQGGASLGVDENWFPFSPDRAVVYGHILKLASKCGREWKRFFVSDQSVFEELMECNKRDILCFVREVKEGGGIYQVSAYVLSRLDFWAATTYEGVKDL